MDELDNIVRVPLKNPETDEVVAVLTGTRQQLDVLRQRGIWWREAVIPDDASSLVPD